MKIAIVTGASSGMGREMVFRLADRYGGFQEIWVIGRRKERLDALDGKVPVKLRNCEGLTAVTELVLPYIPDNSRILQFASAAAFMPQPGFAVYAATKAYVLSYSRALGEELRRRRIFVTAVCPGPVDTEFFGKALNGKPMDPFKRLFMARTNYVVDRAFSDCLKGKPVSVPGLSMKAFYVLCRICPHSLLMKFLTWK